MIGFFSPCSSTRLICSRIFSFLAIVIRLAVGERLGAVAALQQERLAALRRGQPLAQRLDLPGHHDRRQARELRHDALERLGILVDGLLLGRPGSASWRCARRWSRELA